MYQYSSICTPITLCLCPYHFTDSSLLVVRVHPEPRSWLKYAKFEEDLHDIDRARSVYTTALTLLGDDHADEQLYVAFAKFEARCREYERARVIFKYAVERLDKKRAPGLYELYAQFEKQHGERGDIEDVVVQKRRFQYEEVR